MAATRGTTTCMLSNYEELVKTLDNIAGVNAEKVIKKCTSDAKSRAQAWVSAAVCEVYAIKKADVKAALDGKGKGGGQLKVEGNLVESVVLTYKGRVLTPTHFKMKPTQRKPKPYRVSQEVFKGQRKNLPAGVFLASSGGEGSTQIPFQRESESRYPIKSIKTLSVRNKKTYKVKSITWVCPSCGCIQTEATMKKQPAKWIAENPDAYLKGHRSFWLNAFSSPWTPWEKIVTKFLEAQGDPEKLKVVFNTLLGELWEDRGDLEDEDAMLSRREQYDAELPDDVLVLTVGVDTQDNRLEYEVVGHGLYGETWGIKKGIINGRPDTSEVWARLDDVIDHVYRFKNGKGLKVSFTCVDSGGHFTQEVYAECKARQNKRVFAIKGKGGDGIPYTAPPSKVKIVIDGKLIGNTEPGEYDPGSNYEGGTP